MEKLINAIIGKEEPSDRKNFFWNMFGSAVFSFINMFLTICVIRIVGEKEGGIFSIAVTLSQMFLYIAYFEQRTYQVTDFNNKYSFSEYHGSKIYMCVIMLVISFAYVLAKGYSPYKMGIILLMCVYRVIDGYADLYEGQFQLLGRIYLSGKSMAFRSCISTSVLLAVLAVTRDLRYAVLSAIAAAIAGVVIFDMFVAKVFGDIFPNFRWKRIKKIFYECFPLFIGAFLWVYILSASRIAVDNGMSSEYVTYYQTLFMPVSIINLFSTFFFRPALTGLSKLYNENEIAGLVNEIIKLLILIGGFTVICMLGAFFAGIPVLSMISGCDLSSYRNVLVFLMFSGGINSASFFMYYILTIMRKSRNILVGYVSAAIISILISDSLVSEYGLLGASWSFFVAVFSLLIIFTGSFFVIVFKKLK